MNFEVGVVAIRLAREQRLDLALRGLGLDGADLLLALGDGGGIVLHLAKLDQRLGVIEIAFELEDAVEPILKVGAFAGDLLRGGRIVPEIRMLDPGIQLLKAF